MKKSVFLLLIGAMINFTFIVGCSGDEYEFDDYYEKSLNHNKIPRLRSSSAEINQDPYFGYGDIPKYTNECALYALTSLKRSSAQGWYEYGTSAEDYYHELKSYAMENYDYQGGTMTYDTMYKLGKQFGLFENHVKFNSNYMPQDFFRDHNNIKNIRTINMDGHTAKFKEYLPLEGKVEYIDSEGTHSCYLNSIVSVFTR